MDFHLDELTEPQRQAVTHLDGPLLILAGPGSGKTRVITHRMAYLMQQGIPAGNLLGLTFTNKSADEMRQRLSVLTSGSGGPWISTFHRFCSQLLRRNASLVGLGENFTIYDSEDSLKALKGVISDSGVNIGRYTPIQIVRSISNAKNQLLTSENFGISPKTPLDQVAAEIYPLYQSRLAMSNAVDFDDLLFHVALLLEQNQEVRASYDDRYRYVMVDEYQDTNIAQYRIVRALSCDLPNLAVTGDPDQSIYGWRGADIRNILSFEKDYPNVAVVRLEQNYRSTPEILRAADSLIEHNRQRKKKSLFTENPGGEQVRLAIYWTGREEADSISQQIADAVRAGDARPRDFAVLYRTNALSRTFEHALRSYGIPYQIVNGVEFYQRKEIKDVLAYLHLVNNPRNDVAFSRIVNTPPRGIGKKTIQLIRDHARRLSISLLESSLDFENVEGLTKRARTAVNGFVEHYQRIQDSGGAPVEEVVGLALSVTGYADHLEHSNSEEDQQRLANVQELLTAASQFDEQHGDSDGGALESFLEQTALVNDTDAFETESDKVTLMTLHAAKGLEFPVVYVIAVEDGLLPHSRSSDDPLQLEEERRLLFVGMTRAEQLLQLSICKERHFRGSRRAAIPSCFLMELPLDEVRQIEPGPPPPDMVAMTYHSNPDGVDAPSQPARKTSPAAINPAPVMTAAEMAGQDFLATKTTVSPSEFELGMIVKHPKRGLGKIIALSGVGDKRRATVQFVHKAQQRNFILVHSQLLPVRSD